MARKVYIKVEFKIIVDMDDGTEVAEIMDEMKYSLESCTDAADIIETEMVDYEVTDSK